MVLAAALRGKGASGGRDHGKLDVMLESRQQELHVTPAKDVLAAPTACLTYGATFVSRLTAGRPPRRLLLKSWVMRSGG